MIYDDSLTWEENLLRVRLREDDASEPGHYRTIHSHWPGDPSAEMTLDRDPVDSGYQHHGDRTNALLHVNRLARRMGADDIDEEEGAGNHPNDREFRWTIGTGPDAGHHLVNMSFHPEEKGITDEKDIPGEYRHRHMFKHNGNRYSITHERTGTGSNSWETVFSDAFGGYQKTGEKGSSAVPVMRHIHKKVSDFIRKQKPDSLSFSAYDDPHKEKGLKRKSGVGSRQTLYNRSAEALAKEHGYDLKKEKSGNSTYYHLTKKKEAEMPAPVHEGEELYVAPKSTREAVQPLTEERDEVWEKVLQEAAKDPNYDIWEHVYDGIDPNVSFFHSPEEMEAIKKDRELRKKK